MRTIIALACTFIVYVGCANTPGSKDKVMGGMLSADARIAGDIMRYGFPDTGRVLYREGYVLSYDARNRTPNWVGERLNAKRLRVTEKRRGYTFWVDKELGETHRSRSKDYADSGYVRGRLAAAANHQGDKLELKQTYLMSNTAPQIGEQFRQTFWVKFEQQVRAWARETDDLYVFTGPLYLPSKGEDGKRYVHYEVIGDSAVAVPTHFFKVMMRESGRNREMQAFIVPHRAFAGTPRYSDYLVTVDELEQLSGLDFFDELGAQTQERLESAKPTAAWGEDPEGGEGCAEEDKDKGCGCGDEKEGDGCGG